MRWIERQMYCRRHMNRSKVRTFAERKAERTRWYWMHVHGWRTRPCTACAGSGHYDHNGAPPCGACDGTGKEKYPGPKAVYFRKVLYPEQP